MSRVIATFIPVIRGSRKPLKMVGISMSELSLDETGRSIGYNFARLGLPVPESATPALNDGYREGKQRFPSRAMLMDVDYERKLHQLQYSAYCRSRAVDSNVSVQLIKDIEAPVCPVCLIHLTRSTLTGSDWSIDRANNDGAYAAGNLVMMSTQANRAKGALSLDDVLARSGNTDKAVDGLTEKQWSRLASLMYGPCGLETKHAFLVRQTARLPAKLIRASVQDCQDLIALAMRDLKLRRAAVRGYHRYAGVGSGVRYERLIEKAAELARQLTHTHDIWFDDSLFEAFCEWLSSHGDGERLQRMLTVTRSLYQYRNTSTDDEARMRFDTGGYV